MVFFILFGKMFRTSGISKQLAVGSLNVRGIRENQTDLADDMQKYKLDILAVQEHHMKGTGVKMCMSSTILKRPAFKIFSGKVKIWALLV